MEIRHASTGTTMHIAPGPDEKATSLRRIADSLVNWWHGTMLLRVMPCDVVGSISSANNAEAMQA